MLRKILCGALLILIAASILWLRNDVPENHAAHHAKDLAKVETSPLCPWRNPGADLLALFPNATSQVMESHIITGVLLEAQKRLGRPLNPDENPLRVFRVFGSGGSVGSVLVTRVKAEHGGIEIVMGVETNGTIRGVKIQSQREPPDVASAITNASWIADFSGKSVNSPLRMGTDLAEVAPAARISAQAVADGVRHQLIVLTLAELPMEIREFGRQ